MEKLKNLSLKKTIIIYLTISLVISFLSGALVSRVAERRQKQIWWNYVDEEAYFEAVGLKKKRIYSKDSKTKRHIITPIHRTI